MDNLQLGPLIKAVNTLFEKDVDNHLNIAEDAPKLTGTQARLMGYLLAHSDNIIYQRDLEEIFHLSRPTINGLVKRLRENGLVTVSPSAEDKRFKQVQLTAKTAENMRKHQPEFEQIFKDIEQRMTQGMSLDEVQTLRSLLTICLNNLKDS